MVKSSKPSRARNRRPVKDEARPFIRGKGTPRERWAKKCRGKLIYLGWVKRLTQNLIQRGKSREDAEESGKYMARLHFLNRFRREYPQTHRDGFERLDVSRLRAKCGKQVP